MGRDFNEYLNLVYGTKTSSGGQFDAFFVAWSLGRIPDHLYLLCHSSQDTTKLWGARNAAGVNDTTIDALVETVKYSLDLDAMEDAAKQVQEMLYDPTLPNADNYALSHMILYSRTYFDSYNPNLRGIINSHGYGSSNAWTFLNLHWMSGFERLIDSRPAVVLVLYDKPVSFNPLSATKAYEWDIMNRVYDGLINVNPYNHNDVPWLATDWTITQTSTGMDVDFTLRDDVMWQDGRPFTAYDVEFCLEFVKAHSVPRYYATTSTLEDVVVTSTDTLTIKCDREGIGLFYDYAALASVLPEHIWNRTWTSDQAVLDYNPNEPYNVAPGYTEGPNPPPTNLFGTGPWTFQFYDTVNKQCDLYANRNHFISQTEMQTLLSNMFWEIGDYNRDAIVNIIDLTFVSLTFGSKMCSPRYDPDADFNSDGIIDIRDLGMAAFRLSAQKEYP
jgi:ABC-type transport system substrate-binding protein